MKTAIALAVLAAGGLLPTAKAETYWFYCESPGHQNTAADRNAIVSTICFSDIFSEPDSDPQNKIGAEWVEAFKQHGVSVGDTCGVYGGGRYGQTHAQVVKRYNNAIASYSRPGSHFKVVMTGWTPENGFKDTSGLPTFAEAKSREEAEKSYFWCSSVGNVNGVRTTYFSKVFLGDRGDSDYGEMFTKILLQHGWQYPAVCKHIARAVNGPPQAPAEQHLQAEERNASMNGRGKVYLTDFAGGQQ